MGNSAGFGDTRVPTEGDEDCSENIYMRGFPTDENLDPSQFTYRDGINYIKDESNYINFRTQKMIQNFETSVPAGVLKKFLS